MRRRRRCGRCDGGLCPAHRPVHDDWAIDLGMVRTLGAPFASYQKMTSGSNDTLRLQTMRVRFALWVFGLVSCALLVPCLRAQDGKPPMDAHGLLVAAVQAELNANRTDHTAYMYLDHDITPDHDTVYFTVETPQGNLRRKVADHGRTPTADENRADLAEVKSMMDSESKMSKQRTDNQHDDEQAEKLLKLFPVAFVWSFAGERMSDQPGEKGDLVTLNFKPDPNYSPTDMESRVLSQMAGQIVISRPQMRIATIRGALQQDVKIGFGILGRLRQGGSFNVERREVVPRHWQVTDSHVHIQGHALFFKSIGDQEDENRYDFKVSPASTLGQAYEVLQQMHP